METIKSFDNTLAYISREYSRAHNPDSGRSMSRRQLIILSKQLWEKTFSEQEILGWLLYFDTLGNPVTQLAACKWMCNTAINLPRDKQIVLQAVKAAEINHVDPLQYDNPQEIISTFPDVRPTVRPIDPATVSTLHFNYNNGEGMDIYDVEESEESRNNMRRIIDTHFGRKCNPWCILQSGKGGRLTKGSARLWNYYSGFPKQVAFLNGRLHAFSAGLTSSRIWWDRMDKQKGGSRLEILPVPEDPLHRSANFERDLFTGHCKMVGGIFRGDKTNGIYESFRSLTDTAPYISEFYHNGKCLMQIREGLTYAQAKEIYECSDWEKGIIRIPDSVETIEKDVFNGCIYLKKVRLPSHLTRIPKGLFAGCSSLESVELPDGLEEIGDYAFQGCRSIRSIHFPASVSRIGNSAFSGCRSLQNISFTSNALSIGHGAFSACAISEVEITDSIKSIVADAFSMSMNVPVFNVCERWYTMFRERYGSRVHLLQKQPTIKQYA